MIPNQILRVASVRTALAMITWHVGLALVHAQLTPACAPVPGVRDKCEAWVATYDNPNGLRCSSGDPKGDIPHSMAVSPSGNFVYVTGVSLSIDGLCASDFTTIAYDQATGKQVWISRYNGPLRDPQYTSSHSIAYAIAVSPDGKRLYVTGIEDDFSRPRLPTTVAYDAATGAQLWASTYQGDATLLFNVFAHTVTVNPSGTVVYVTGNEFGATIAYDAVTGRQLWAAIFDWGHFGELASLAVSADGTRIFVTGYINGVSWHTIAYDSLTGEQKWETLFTSDFGYVFSLQVSPDGTRVFITGFAQGQKVGAPPFTVVTYDLVTLAYNAATGSKLWEKRYNTPVNRFNVGLSLAVSPLGDRVYVTGFSALDYGTEPFNNYDYVTLAYDAATGNQAWVQRYNFYDYDLATSVTISPDGQNVYVTGTSGNLASIPTAPPPRGDVATIAYDATTGRQNWVARYNNSLTQNDSDYPIVARLSSDSKRLFVVGQFGHPTQSQYSFFDVDYNYGLLAYDTGLILPSAVVSRKTHGSAGIFDVYLPLTGNPGIECRTGGTNNAHQIVFKYSTAVTVPDATVTPASGKTAEKDGPPVRSPDGKEITVNLKNVENAQTVTIKLVGVSDGTHTNDVSIQMGVLIGDTNADGFVNSGDISQTKSQSGQFVTSSDFREDLNVDGALNSADIAMVKSLSGTALLSRTAAPATTSNSSSPATSSQSSSTRQRKMREWPNSF